MTPFNLRAARVNRGVTIAALAKETGVGRRTIMRVEQGQVPSAPVALKLARWVGDGKQPTDLWPLEDVAA